ncbi:MAG: hypothetical protein JWO11_148 [Nocardioides sp.]|nr:hypothetical protein [Nocardioides sp.]
MLLGLDPRIDRAVLETIAAAHWQQTRGLADPRVLSAYGARVAAGDRVCRQLAVFEHGGLTDFLDLRAEASLLDRCDHVRSWATAPMGGYVLAGRAGDVLLVRDLAHGDVLDVLDPGALRGRVPGAAVLGRLVPVDVPPGRMFESRPQRVDLVTAREAARRVAGGDRLGWLEAIDRGRAQGRLAAGFSCGRGKQA